MDENFSAEIRDYYTPKENKSSYLIHLILLIITFLTTIIAGLEWTTGKIGPYEITDFTKGLPYAISIIFVLACHEFGHYFAAKYHRVKATLPYFIPFPPIPGFFNFGTMGAVIRTKSITPNNKAMFDIGVAGPISGFIACIIVLIYGFTHLPPVDYILTIHPDYFSPEYGKDTINLEFGSTLIFEILKYLFTKPGDFIPPMSEVYHYPYLCVGWFGLFVTAMNLIPVGQLDGGHIIYSMFGGKIHEAIAGISMIILMILGAGGIISSLFGLPFEFGWSGWLFWALILFFVIKIKHPPVPYFEKLDNKRMILGYIAIAIFILSFSPTPFIISL
ncbi:site-2 protease family protein [Rosettibacter firmus]|uniref:site-2 protease family protein n=1 Tax=Rosettibacter firmus TaxID=3111522 RepID=UPI00336BF034